MVVVLQVLDQTAAPSLERISWNDVIQMGEQLSKQATNGTLFDGIAISIFKFRAVL